MCRIRCADGRAGLAWVEWNLNQPPRRAGTDASAAGAPGATGAS